MSRQSKHEVGNSGRNRRTEGIQRPLHLDSRNRRLVTQTGRSLARRAVRESGEACRATNPASLRPATSTFASYDHFASFGLRLGITAVVVIVLVLHAEQFRLAFSVFSKALS